MVTQEVPAPEPKLVALIGLHGRALRTAAEVRLLAMNGFAAGAEARWRSLHELAVVACVLHAADATIARRYLAYSDIENWADMKQYQASAPSLGRELFTDEAVQATQEGADDVIAEFGPEMRQPNGWARPLFTLHKPKQAVTFKQLEDRVGLGHLRPFYRLGSHHVHAGSRAAELNLSRETAQAPLITVGATVFADTAEVSQAALISVLQVTSVLTTESMHYELRRPVEAQVGLKCIERFVDDAGKLYVTAARAAKERGWINHEIPDD